MSDTNSKNIRVFVNWFGLDTKSKKEEYDLCELLYLNAKEAEAQWSSDKTSFWVPQKNVFYKHFCNNGLFFNYPIKLEKLPKNDIIVTRFETHRVGKIRGAEARSSAIGEIAPHFQKMAQEDLAENPIPESGFDWKHVKDSVESEGIL